MSFDLEFQSAIYGCVCTDVLKYQFNFPHTKSTRDFYCVHFLINVWRRQFHDDYVTLFQFLGICKIGKVLYSHNVIYTFCTHFAPHSMIIYPLHNFCCILYNKLVYVDLVNVAFTTDTHKNA